MADLRAGPQDHAAEPWLVYVDDNYHYQDEDARYFWGAFESYDAAVAACRAIVDEFLTVSTAKTAEEMFQAYIGSGEDPWIKGPKPDDPAQVFSAWSYACRRCEALRPLRKEEPSKEEPGKEDVGIAP